MTVAARRRRCCATNAAGERCGNSVWRADGLFCSMHNPARPIAAGALAANAVRRLRKEGRVPPEFYDDLAHSGLDYAVITWEMRLRALEAWTAARDLDDYSIWHDETVRLRAKQAARLATYVAQAKKGYPGAGRMGQLAWLLVHGELHPRAGQKTRQLYLKRGEKAAAIVEDQARREAYLAKKKAERALRRAEKKAGLR